MAEYLKQIVFIESTADKTSKELYEELITNGSLTIKNDTIIYDKNNIYITDDPDTDWVNANYRVRWHPMAISATEEFVKDTNRYQVEDKTSFIASYGTDIKTGDMFINYGEIEGTTRRYLRVVLLNIVNYEGREYLYLYPKFSMIEPEINTSTTESENGNFDVIYTSEVLTVPANDTLVIGLDNTALGNFDTLLNPHGVHILQTGGSLLLDKRLGCVNSGNIDNLINGYKVDSSGNITQLVGTKPLINLGYYSLFGHNSCTVRLFNAQLSTNEFMTTCGTIDNRLCLIITNSSDADATFQYVTMGYVNNKSNNNISATINDLFERVIALEETNTLLTDLHNGEGV